MGQFVYVIRKRIKVRLPLFFPLSIVAPSSRLQSMLTFVCCACTTEQLAPEKAIFIFVDEVLPATAALMSAIYEEHKDEDG